MFRVIAGNFSRLLFLCVILSIAADTALSGVLSYSGDEIQLYASLGNLQTASRADWIEGEAAIPWCAQRQKSAEFVAAAFTALDEFEGTSAPVPLLSWRHGVGFVSIIGDGRVHFSVNYTDPYGNPPSAGYPKVVVWTEGSSSSSTLALHGTGTVYEADMDLPRGSYGYRYIGKNDFACDEYLLEDGTLQVTDRPCQPVTTGIPDAARLTSARIRLAWTPLGPQDSPGTYRLYIGKTPASIIKVYEGHSPEFELSRLDPGQQYYWQVESVNAQGASSRSPLYGFSTIGAVRSAFNFPNPFNPSLGEQTHFVFSMDEPGAAELRLFSEYGDLCWQTSVSDLLPGSNQVSYNGNDDNGDHLHNGTYVCVITKKYATKEDKERCRILVIH